MRLTPQSVAALGALLAAGCGQWTDDAFCDQPGCGWTREQWQRVEGLAGVPDPPPDRSNRFWNDPRAAALGQRFYFDTAFSGLARQQDALRRRTTLGRAPEGQPIKVSCATCHDLQRGGVDVTSVPGNVSIGAGVTDVNASATVNAAYRKTLFWNGRLDALWCLNVVVAESETTMNGNRLQTAHVLAEQYGDDFEAAFKDALPVNWRLQVSLLPPNGKPGGKADCQTGDPAEPWLDVYDCLPPASRMLATSILVLWSKAIAAFEQQLTSRDSAFDQFVAEGPGSPRLSPGAQRGARLFVDKAGCIDCHNGPHLTDEDFHNVGVPQLGPGVPTLADCPGGAPCDCVKPEGCLPFGAFTGQLRFQDRMYPWLRITSSYSDDTSDAERQSLRTRPLTKALQGAWRTPSLRDVALTAPYMHNGVFRTLEEVVWHYNSGGRSSAAFAVGRASVTLRPLGLSDAEAADLVEFLQSLTGAPLPVRLRSPP